MGWAELPIALQLGISEKTVSAHVQAIYRQLEIHGVVELTRWAYENHVIDSAET